MATPRAKDLAKKSFNAAPARSIVGDVLPR